MRPDESPPPFPLLAEGMGPVPNKKLPPADGRNGKGKSRGFSRFPGRISWIAQAIWFPHPSTTKQTRGRFNPASRAPTEVPRTETILDAFSEAAPRTLQRPFSWGGPPGTPKGRWSEESPNLVNLGRPLLPKGAANGGQSSAPNLGAAAEPCRGMWRTRKRGGFINDPCPLTQSTNKYLAEMRWGLKPGRANG